MMDNSDQKRPQWFLYHSPTKIKRGPFTTEGLCEIVLNEGVNINDLVLALPGWKKWENFQDCNDVMECYLIMLKEREAGLPPIFDLGEDSQEIPPIPVNIFTTTSDVESDRISGGDERRKHPRLKLELKALFVLDKKTFRTKTIDISLGGIKISDSLPESYLGQNISVYLSSAETNFSIKFDAIPVANGNNLKQIKFIGQSESSSKHLEALLQSLSEKLNNDKQIKKTA